MAAKASPVHQAGALAERHRWLYDTFVRTGRRRRFRKGQAVFLQGEPATTCYAVEAGRISVGRLTFSGREIIHFLRYPGSVFGFAELLLQRERARSAFAAEDSVLWVLPGERLLALLEDEPALGHALLLTVADRLLTTQRIVESLAADPVRERLVGLLLRLSGELGDVPLRLTHDEVARLIGSTRQTVTTILGELHAAGIVAVHPRSIAILDRRRLLDHLGGDPVPGAE